ncbi:MAG: 7-cyano-7-deazaguanine reductase [Candidatus Paceibacterota bacterium]
MNTEKKWSDPSILRSIKNPSSSSYEVRIKDPEVTFIGAPEQPDFAVIYIIMYPKDRIIELKSLKKYFWQFRETLISYERFMEVVYNDLLSTYQPVRLWIRGSFNPRGGIYTTITVDSDLPIRGGSNQFKDYPALDSW